MQFPLPYALLALCYLQLVTAGHILSWMTTGSRSHFIAMKPLLTALAKREHSLTVVAPILDKDLSQMKNVNYIYMPENDLLKVNSSAVFDGVNPVHNTSFYMDVFMQAQRNTHANQRIQQLIASKPTFDVAILSFVSNDIGLYLAKEVFKAPTIFYSPVGRISYLDSAIGNPTNPSYLPEMVLESGQKMSFSERLINTVVHTAMSLGYDYYLLPTLADEIKRLYKLDRSPNLVALLNDIDFVFYNRNPAFLVSPVTPNTILVGGAHLTPAKKLPSDLQEILDEGETVYVSFGSVLVGSDLPKDKLQILLSVFSKLAPLKVLWKWETEIMENKPDNVILRKWLPQQDVLGHPNVKLFVTHGGHASTDEAIYHGVPTVVMPAFADQFANAQLIQREGLGKRGSWTNLTEEGLLDSIQTVLQDPSYRSTAAKYGALMRDDLVHPLDRAVYYTEYAMRHKGAKHLRAPYKELYLFQYLGLDVFAFLFTAVALVLFLVYKSVRVCCKCICGRRVEKEKRS